MRSMKINLLTIFGAILSLREHYAFGTHSLARRPVEVLTHATRSSCDETEKRNSRRGFLAFALSNVAMLTSNANAATAKDEIFKPNPLTSPVLEQVSNCFELEF